MIGINIVINGIKIDIVHFLTHCTCYKRKDNGNYKILIFKRGSEEWLKIYSILNDIKKGTKSTLDLDKFIWSNKSIT